MGLFNKNKVTVLEEKANKSNAANAVAAVCTDNSIYNNDSTFAKKRDFPSLKDIKDKIILFKYTETTFTIYEKGKGDFVVFTFSKDIKVIPWFEIEKQ